MNKIHYISLSEIPEEERYLEFFKIKLMQESQQDTSKCLSIFSCLPKHLLNTFGLCELFNLIDCEYLLRHIRPCILLELLKFLETNNDTDLQSFVTMVNHYYNTFPEFIGQFEKYVSISNIIGNFNKLTINAIQQKIKQLMTWHVEFKKYDDIDLIKIFIRKNILYVFCM